MNDSLSDIREITIDANTDFRGDIYTTYKDSCCERFFNHDKVSLRYKDVLVGIHGDYKTWKLVTCLYGRVYSVLVDNRPNSKDYLKHKCYVLSNENRLQLLLPPGIGNSFFVLSDVCVYNYKLSYDGAYVDHDEQFTLKWDDPRLGIKWPHSSPIVSARDSVAL